MGIPEQTVYDTTNKVQRWTIAGKANVGKLPRNLRKQYLNLSHENYGNMILINGVLHQLGLTVQEIRVL